MPPNNYPFYSEEEKYVPVVQADGGQLSGGAAGAEWLRPWARARKQQQRRCGRLTF